MMWSHCHQRPTPARTTNPTKPKRFHTQSWMSFRRSGESTAGEFEVARVPRRAETSLAGFFVAGAMPSSPTRTFECAIISSHVRPANNRASARTIDRDREVRILILTGSSRDIWSLHPAYSLAVAGALVILIADR